MEWENMDVRLINNPTNVKYKHIYNTHAYGLANFQLTIVERQWMSAKDVRIGV